MALDETREYATVWTVGEYGSAFLFISLLPVFMTKGTIKTVNKERGFGFIKVEGSDDVFFHSSECGDKFDTLDIGQAVEFEQKPGDNGKGPKAKNVVAA